MLQIADYLKFNMVVELIACLIVVLVKCITLLAQVALGVIVYVSCCF